MNESKELIFSNNDGNGYGPWESVVKDYLFCAYLTKAESFTSAPFTYKVRDRGEVTTFYFDNGTTLFSVTNERLSAEAKTFGIIAEEQKPSETSFFDEFNGITLIDDEPVVSEVPFSEEKALATEPVKDEATEAEVTTEVETPVSLSEEEVTAAAELMNQSEKTENEEKTEDVATGAEVNNAKEPATNEAAVETAEESKEDIAIEMQAVSKLRSYIPLAPDEGYKELVRHLIGLCCDSATLAKDVMQEHKSWEGMMDYIFKRAQEYAQSLKCNRSIAITHEIVFEFAEDYFYADDLQEYLDKKAAEEKAKIDKAKREAEAKKKAEAKKQKEAKKKAAEAKKKADEEKTDTKIDETATSEVLQATTKVVDIATKTEVKEAETEVKEEVRESKKETPTPIVNSTTAKMPEFSHSDAFGQVDMINMLLL